MLLAIALTATAAVVVIAGALLASGNQPSGTDDWMLHGPHSLH